MTSRRPNDIVTVQQHILEKQRAHPEATGAFSLLLSGITLATKIIAAHVRRAGLLDVLGNTGRINVQGEEVQRLDQLAHETILRCVGNQESVGIIVSEEDEEPRILKEPADRGRYIVLFDPLDGSSNIDVNVSIGTIFSILRWRDHVAADDVMGQILQPGHQQVAAGYVIYGGSTVLTYTIGNGVNMFTLDPSIGAYVLHQENVSMPAIGRTYSLNEAYRNQLPEHIQQYIEWAKDQNYSLRYIGSLVADFHRTLLRGGIFLYPATRKSPKGKLRLLYEANPMALLAESAGGVATDGEERILDKIPTAMHERTPLLIGSRYEVERAMAFKPAALRVEI